MPFGISGSPSTSAQARKLRRTTTLRRVISACSGTTSGAPTIDQDAEKLWEGLIGRLGIVGGQHFVEKHVPDKVNLRFPGAHLRLGYIGIVVFLDLQILQRKAS